MFCEVRRAAVCCSGGKWYLLPPERFLPYFASSRCTLYTLLTMSSQASSSAGPSRSPSPAAEGSGSSSRSASPEADNGVEVSNRTFASLGIIPELCKSCVSLGYKNPSNIQVESIPSALEGKDIIGLAQTGSGKTAAFTLPILQTLWENPQPFYALVLAPTR